MNLPDLRQLRYFVAVAERLHFGRAAAALHISQPPLSRAIRALEELLGVALLARTRRRVELTAEGARFLDEARRLATQLETAVAELHGMAAGERGRLRIGFVSLADYGVLPGLLKAYKAARPGVALGFFAQRSPGGNSDADRSKPGVERAGYSDRAGLAGQSRPARGRLPRDRRAASAARPVACLAPRRARRRRTRIRGAGATPRALRPPMLIHPDIDPVAISIGPLALRWYGLMYLVGVAAAWWLGLRRIEKGLAPVTRQQFDDLLFMAVLGVILGGRAR